MVKKISVDDTVIEVKPSKCRPNPWLGETKMEDDVSLENTV